MYKHLYDQFRHWFRGGMVYFYSDPHFGDEEMKHLRKNYIGDEEQVKKINSKIGKTDTLVILGDVGDTEFIKKLRGYKVLIMGNHDAGASNYIRIKTDKVTELTHHYDPYYAATGPDTFIGEHIYEEKVIKKATDNRLFDEVYEGPVFISEKILISHEPIDYPYALNIHGHEHNVRQVKNRINVCAENINYTPISLKDIVESGMLKNINSLHRATIDRATERKKNR